MTSHGLNVVGLKIAVVVFGAVVICAPSRAAENWPDSVDQYVAQVRAA
jgi:hypothetical protein